MNCLRVGIDITVVLWRIDIAKKCKEIRKQSKRKKERMKNKEQWYIKSNG